MRMRDAIADEGLCDICPERRANGASEAVGEGWRQVRTVRIAKAYDEQTLKLNSYA
jgi:hypothetical protein